MQLKITELLYSTAKATDTLEKSLPIVGGVRGEGQEQPATLFSSGHVRGEVICNVSGRGNWVWFVALTTFCVLIVTIFMSRFDASFSSDI